MRRLGNFARLWVALSACLLFIGVFSASAQGNIIQIGQNTTGETTTANGIARFTIQVAAPQSVIVQVLGITPGFAPSFRVLDPAGVQVADVANVGAPSTPQTPVQLVGAGSYTIEVSAATPGQFLLSVQAGAPLQPPQPLQVGQQLSGTVNATTPIISYSFIGVQTDVLRLVVRSNNPNAGPIITLRDPETDTTLAVSSARLSGVSYRLPAGSLSYLLDVAASGATLPEAYTVCLESENGPAVCGGTAPIANVPTAVPATAVPATPVPVVQPVVIPPGGPCSVASGTGGVVNLRSGPSTTNGIVGNLTGNTIAPVLARLADASWYQVSVNGVLGFVSATVVRVGGNCASTPVLPTPTPVPPTVTPVVTSIVLPTLTFTPTYTPTGVPPLPTATLNFNGTPNFGSASLISGFVPDPFTQSVTSGGSVDVSYLGGGCRGFATSNPDFSINYTSGSFSLLRFYFVPSSGGDATLIVNSPSTNYFCNDDSFGTLNPAIDFSTPSSGRYDIWVGSFSSGAFISGTLYVTESSANTP